MPSTQRQHQTTRSQPNLVHQINLFEQNPPTASTTFSAPSRGILDQESAYLCAWLRSRLEDGLWLIRQESALTATEQQRRQVTRLAHKARALRLPVWPPRQRTQREVA